MHNATLIGVDVGGTKINAGRVVGGTVEAKSHFKNPAKASADVILGTVIEAIEGVVTPEVSGIGVGTPGLVDAQTGTVMEIHNIPAWKDYPLQTKLKEHFNIPVFVNNDANCYAVGEQYFGQGQGFNNIVAMTLGTGLGTGLILNGALHNGKHGGAGEFGVVKYLDRNLEYYCASNYFTSIHGLDSLTLSELAQTGDQDALNIFHEYGHHLGHAILTVMSTVDPEIIILGGSIANAYPLFKDGISEVVRSYPIARVAEDIQIVVGSLSDGAILGAAALFYAGSRGVV